jgi:hypothetical protein
LYSAKPIRWSYKGALPVSVEGSTRMVRLVDHPCDIFFNTLAPHLDIKNLTISANRDCSGTIFKLPGSTEARLRFNIDRESTWRSDVFNRYFHINEALEDAIKMVLRVPWDEDLREYHYPSISLHARTAMIPNDEQRFFGQLSDFAKSFVNCLNLLRAEHVVRDSTIANQNVFIAADVDELLSDLSHGLRDIGVFSVFSAVELGGIGHVERLKNVTNLALRMHTEFEIIRHSKYFIIGRSGFSLMAWKLRVHKANVLVVNGEDNRCQPIFVNGSDFYTVSND